MSPSEIRELRNAHRGRVIDLLVLGALTLVVIALIAFDAGAVPWFAVSWLFVACAAVVFMRAPKLGDQLAQQALRERAQEAQARENTRPLAQVIAFPLDREDGRSGAA